MASKRRNMFYQNKKQETANLPPFCDCISYRPSDIMKPPQGTLPDEEITRLTSFKPRMTLKESQSTRTLSLNGLTVTATVSRKAMTLAPRRSPQTAPSTPTGRCEWDPCHSLTNVCQVVTRSPVSYSAGGRRFFFQDAKIKYLLNVQEKSSILNKLMSEGLQDIQSQKDGKLHVPISVVSCFLFSQQTDYLQHDPQTNLDAPTWSCGAQPEGLILTESNPSSPKPFVRSSTHPGDVEDLPDGCCFRRNNPVLPRRLLFNPRTQAIRPAKWKHTYAPGVRMVSVVSMPDYHAIGSGFDSGPR
ncbi:hypothetical protein AAG570_005969 [Ranatra chinensis]|uniref:Uncharacterized protein n=1 Tax=Ranatra chinensis TaxID=642074 RepID=A0ABD0YIF5_9HEMI